MHDTASIKGPPRRSQGNKYPNLTLSPHFGLLPPHEWNPAKSQKAKNLVDMFPSDQPSRAVSKMKGESTSSRAKRHSTSHHVKNSQEKL